MMESNFRRLTLGFMLKQNVVKHPEKVGVVDVDRNRRFSYVEFNRRVNKVADALLGAGIGKGDKVATLMHDRSEFLELLYGTSKVGAVLVPVNYRLTPGEIAFIVNHSEAKMFFFENEYCDVIDRIREQLSSVDKMISLDGKGGPADLTYEEFVAPGSVEEPEVEVKDEDMCALIYTSGTTGGPKGAIKTHRSTFGWALDMILEFNITYRDRMLNPFPLYHHGGWIISICTIGVGGTNYILGSFDAGKFLRVIDEEKITCTIVVPTMLNMILKLGDEELAKYDVSSLRRIMSAAAPLFTETKEKTLKYFYNAELYELYSSTEAFYTVLRPEDIVRKVRCHGMPAFGMEVTILDDNGQEVPRGKQGLIYGRGISVFEGYYKNDEANAKAFVGDWFTAEDVGYFDEEGYLYVVDRKKDMILSGGENIASVEVEDALMEHEKVLEVAAIGVPHEIWGESVHVVVALKPGESATEEEIIEWCRGRLAGFKRPRSVEFIDRLPRNPSGKVLKRQLREMYMQRRQIKDFA